MTEEQKQIQRHFRRQAEEASRIESHLRRKWKCVECGQVAHLGLHRPDSTDCRHCGSKGTIFNCYSYGKL